MRRRRKRILVTGGAGFLGSHLCDRLVERGDDVLCLDNFFTGAKDNVAHLLGQSKGFFQDDFAGRLANRVMQIGPAVDDNFFTFFEAVWFVTVYFITALIVMGGITPVLAIPMLLWLLPKRC